MSTSTHLIKVRILTPLKDKKVGDIVDVDLTSPQSLYWKARLNDAKIDNCCEIVKEVEEKSDVIQSELKEEEVEVVKQPRSKASKTTINEGE